MLARRIVLFFYVAVLFFGTHCNLNDGAFKQDSWWQAAAVKVKQFCREPLFGPHVRGDKAIHFGAFAMLTVLALRAAWSLAGYRELKNRGTLLRYGTVIVGVLLIYGLIDEASQPFFGRNFDWLDYVANVMGILTIAALYATLIFWKNFEPASKPARAFIPVSKP